MKLTKKVKILSLFIWSALLGGLYWGVGETRLTMPVTITYFVLCLVGSCAYVLVSGGLRPRRGKDDDAPNPLRLPADKQTLYSQVLLILILPFYFIFILDYLFLRFFS